MAFLQEMKSRQAPGPAGGQIRGGFAPHQPSQFQQDTARVASGKFHNSQSFGGTRGPAKSIAQNSEYADVEFYYMDREDNQIGPASLQEMKQKFKQGVIGGDCFYW